MSPSPLRADPFDFLLSILPCPAWISEPYHLDAATELYFLFFFSSNLRFGFTYLRMVSDWLCRGG